LSSIEGGEAQEWIVGTRYHPKDLYNSLIEMQEEVYDKEGTIVEYESVYEKFERQTEDNGDGTHLATKLNVYKETFLIDSETLNEVKVTNGNA